MALFDAPTGQATQVAPQGINFDYAQKRLAPAYARALKTTQQDFSGRGLLDSGLDAQAELGLQESYLSKLGDASFQDANVAEQNRRRLEQRGWQVQDRDKQLAWLREQADAGADAAARQQWADLIGKGAGAVGTVAGGMYGGPVGASLGGAAGSQVGSGLGDLITNGKKKANYGADLGGTDMGLDYDPSAYGL